jgi:hypothetical protein
VVAEGDSDTGGSGERDGPGVSDPISPPDPAPPDPATEPGGATEPGRTPGRHRLRWLIGVGVVVLVVGWLLLLGARSVSAYRHDKSGLALLQQVKADLSPGELTSSGSVQLLDEAHGQFTSAQSDLSSPLFAPIAIVPVIGRQFRSVKALSTAAATVSSVGSTFLSRVHQVLNQPHSAGPDRVSSLRELATVSTTSAAQLSRIDTGPPNALLSPLASKHNQFVTQLDDARNRLVKAAGVSAAVATILRGPQNYLVLASNNAEMRAGSGAFLDVGVAATSDGSVHLNQLGPSGARSLPVGQVTPTGDLQRNWGWLHPGDDFRNLGLTPQFDVTAPLAAKMWTSLTGQPIDGVLSLDVAGLRQIMDATGPVEVDGTTVTSDSVEQFLLRDQYVGLTVAAGASTTRRDALGQLAGAVLSSLQGQSANLTSLATSVSSAVSGRHLMVWSADPTTQAAWVVSGVSGSLTAHSLGVSLINVGGNKLDPYLPVRVTVTATPSGADTAVTLTTTVSNTTPSGLSTYAAGPFPGNPAPYGSYIGLVTANLPAGASHITVTGAGPVAVEGAEGPTWLVAAPLTLDRGASATVVTHFTLPGSRGAALVVPSARIPPEQWTANGRTRDDGSSFTITW